jgi:hypothetical protein
MFMSKYSIKGSDAFDAKLDADFAVIVQALTTSQDGPLCVALILIGGYGRSEGTPYIVGDRQLPFNDYDFVVVSEAMSRQQRIAVQARLRQLEQNLSQQLGLPIDLCLYPYNDLQRAEFSLLNYEMRYGHKVIWGKQDVLNDMPAYAHDAIPLSEGTRLLLNRGKLLLDIRQALRTGKELTADERLRFMKFVFKAFLAFGDCALLLLRTYDLSYVVKKKRVETVAATDVPDPVFLIVNYQRAIVFKEWGDCTTLDDFDLAAEYERVRHYFVQFFHWYESCRLGRTVRDTASYTEALAQGPRECPCWKALALNGSFFRLAALSGGSRLLLAHPRARLYLSLLLLLADEPVDLATASRILATQASGREGIEQRFFQLQRRFS